MIRGFRRLIIRYFGGFKKFLICVFLLFLLLYSINTLFADDGTRQIWDGQKDYLNMSESKCGIKCPEDKVAFYIKSGQGVDVGPTICYEGTIVMSPQKNNVNRGLNTVFIDDKTKQISDVKVFDTYVEDSSLIRHLKVGVPANHVVIMASFDDAFTNMRESRPWMQNYGSSMIIRGKFRDSYVFIGQRGLREGKAIEFHTRKGAKDFSDPIEKTGCFSIPLGELRSLDDVLPHFIKAPDMKLGNFLQNCGLPKSCDEDHMSVSVYTGSQNSELPEICIDEFMVMGKELNGAGRGINVVVVDPATSKPTILTHEDTYAEESTNLEIFLETLTAGDIVIAVTSDDASKKLSYRVKEMFNNIGSSMIQNLRFRDLWYFIGQQGIKGFSTMEQISFSGLNNEWPTPMRAAYCVPKKIKGSKVVPDQPVYRNDDRRNFCTKYQGYLDFCDNSHVDNPLQTVGLSDSNVAESPIYGAPIIIIPGVDHNVLVKSLQTAIMQPGINSKLVVVMVDEKYPEYNDLVQLFGFTNFTLPSSKTYQEHFSKAMDVAWKLFPDINYMMFVEEEVLLGPDFLTYMAQCLPVLDRDPTVAAVSAWNDNGFPETSSMTSLVYRVEQFPGLAFLLKRSVYENQMKDKMDNCCGNRSWDGWALHQDFEILIPDVSRVYRHPVHDYRPERQRFMNIFHRERRTTFDLRNPLSNVPNLISEEYDAMLHSLISDSELLNAEQINACFNKTHIFFQDLQLKHEDTTFIDFWCGPTSKIVAVDTLGFVGGYICSHKANYALYFHQSSQRDYEVLSRLCTCFGLASADGLNPRGLHKNVLRFSIPNSEIYLVGSKSIFWTHKPESYMPVFNKT